MINSVYCKFVFLICYNGAYQLPVLALCTVSKSTDAAFGERCQLQITGHRNSEHLRPHFLHSKLCVAAAFCALVALLIVKNNVSATLLCLFWVAADIVLGISEFLQLDGNLWSRLLIQRYSKVFNSQPNTSWYWNHISQKGIVKNCLFNLVFFEKPASRIPMKFNI